ncbi:MAG: hypothetical protein LC808_14810 [Actinobacteria bacterium]|nr:hypothetical protein [Actinomycetota bacterium]
MARPAASTVVGANVEHLRPDDDDQVGDAHQHVRPDDEGLFLDRRLLD